MPPVWPMPPANTVAGPEAAGARVQTVAADDQQTPAPPPAPVLRLTDLAVRRGARMLLSDINWTVEREDRWALLGPNGAGKTTLLQIASATMHPTSGAAEVLGERLGAVDVFTLRRRIGLSSAALAQRIPERERALDVVVTAARAVVGRWRESYDPAEFDRARGLLDRFGVGELAAACYGTLSEGERKRVQICRALMNEPELLLLDEPAAGMDLGSREDLVEMLSDLALDPEAPTTIHVTHHVEELPLGVTHALLLSGGRIVTAGPLDDVMTSANLSATFGIPLEVEYRHERWSARAAPAMRRDSRLTPPPHVPFDRCCP